LTIKQSRKKHCKCVYYWS